MLYKLKLQIVYNTNIVYGQSDTMYRSMRGFFLYIYKKINTKNG